MNSTSLHKIIFLLIILVLITACAKPAPKSTLTMTDPGFATFDANKKLQVGQVSADQTIFLHVAKIDGFRNTDGRILPEILIEIPEINLQKKFLGEAIRTPSNSLDALTLPLGVLGSGAFTVKITVKDRYVNSQKVITKTLVI
ncbi:MAG: hypothetical protein KAT43_06370 [Nanoarchaeota archaeon]|nr:hypothetical protein [Nanoarchaeota archaeon]